MGDNKPYSFDDGPGASGFSVDVLREVARKADLTFQFRAGSWPEIYDAFLRGELDVIDGISFSAERAENILFTEPYHLRQTYLMHNTQRPLRDINTISDLKGLRVGIVRDVYYRDALQAEGVSLTSYDSVHSLIRALAFGWVDVVVGPRLTLQYYANKAGFGFLEIAGPAPLGDLATEDFRIGVLKSNEDLYQKIASGLEQVPKERISQLLQRWQDLGGNSLVSGTSFPCRQNSAGSLLKRALFALA